MKFEKSSDLWVALAKECGAKLVTFTGASLTVKVEDREATWAWLREREPLPCRVFVDPMDDPSVDPTPIPIGPPMDRGSPTTSRN